MFETALLFKKIVQHGLLVWVAAHCWSSLLLGDAYDNGAQGLIERRKEE